MARYPSMIWQPSLDFSGDVVKDENGIAGGLYTCMIVIFVNKSNKFV